MDWKELLKEPNGGDHLVQLYQDEAFLGEAVSTFITDTLQRGEAGVIIATPGHRARFGFQSTDQIRVLDAEETLARFMVEGQPNWTRFHEVIGGLIAELRLRYPAVRAYGEMVNVLWQRGERDAAIRLEEYWNDLQGLQTFTLLCAYEMDPLDPASYAGPLECVCRVHSHLIPARDSAGLDKAVEEASQEIFEAPLSGILLSLAANHRQRVRMPVGQATLLWLKRNMPRSSERVLSAVRARLSASSS
jgi:hypothetical protein